MPHKRAKASVRNAKKKALGHDLPVTGAQKNDDTPKAFGRLMRFKQITEEKRKEKQKQSKEKANTATKPKLELQPGERLKDFTLRVEQQYRDDMTQTIRAAKPLTDRKKKNREARKQKKLAKKERDMELYGGRDFDDLKDNVKFGEVADAPPVISKVPKARGRGKAALEAKTKEANKKPDGGYESSEDEGMKQLKASHKRKLANMSASARKQLDDERERAIEAYRAKKAKKMAESGLTPLFSS
ncbi:uncharacterized protein BYT42DRAFT_579108 [Radiomyces spectabilis]|uniref:uncharacterized protein n=1 Tax=Radiomyces spectabilis TaxID=64574 RepID=UPI00221F5926|nr:uncharacterized protein BYT42DRAFT_579108 [Radiomyces spectabilis]KAI8373070.1 hypothetical protein BYT42DRAFT_579108 [Radiomyces spectabilis]